MLSIRVDQVILNKKQSRFYRSRFYYSFPELLFILF
nr:MAG TPA: hypothetical protein [Caudoviricetes sp.]